MSQGVSLSALVGRVVDVVYTSFADLQADLPSRPEAERRTELLLTIHATRQRIMRLYVATQWALQQGGIAAAAGRALATLDAQDAACTDSADRLYYLHDALPAARAPPHDVATALDLLSTGRYLRLPAVIDHIAGGPERVLAGPLRAPPPPGRPALRAPADVVTADPVVAVLARRLADAQAKRTAVEARLGCLLRRRLLELSRPPRLRILSVRDTDGRVRIGAEEEFEVELMLVPGAVDGAEVPAEGEAGAGADPMVWVADALRMLVREAPAAVAARNALGASARDASGRPAGGPGSAEPPAPPAATQGVEMSAPQCDRLQFELGKRLAASQQPLELAYALLHDVSMGLTHAALAAQARALQAAPAWRGGALRVEPLPGGGLGLAVGYWQQRMPAPAPPAPAPAAPGGRPGGQIKPEPGARPAAITGPAAPALPVVGSQSAEGEDDSLIGGLPIIMRQTLLIELHPAEGHCRTSIWPPLPADEGHTLAEPAAPGAARAPSPGPALQLTSLDLETLVLEAARRSSIAWLTRTRAQLLQADDEVTAVHEAGGPGEMPSDRAGGAGSGPLRRRLLGPDDTVELLTSDESSECTSRGGATLPGPARPPPRLCLRSYGGAAMFVGLELHSGQLQLSCAPAVGVWPAAALREVEAELAAGRRQLAWAVVTFRRKALAAALSARAAALGWSPAPCAHRALRVPRPLPLGRARAALAAKASGPPMSPAEAAAQSEALAVARRVLIASALAVPLPLTPPASAAVGGWPASREGAPAYFMCVWPREAADFAPGVALLCGEWGPAGLPPKLLRVVPLTLPPAPATVAAAAVAAAAREVPLGAGTAADGEPHTASAARKPEPTAVRTTRKRGRADAAADDVDAVGASDGADGAAAEAGTSAIAKRRRGGDDSKPAAALAVSAAALAAEVPTANGHAVAVTAAPKPPMVFPASPADFDAWDSSMRAGLEQAVPAAARDALASQLRAAGLRFVEEMTPARTAGPPRCRFFFRLQKPAPAESAPDQLPPTAAEALAGEGRRSRGRGAIKPSLASTVLPAAGAAASRGGLGLLSDEPGLVCLSLAPDWTSFTATVLEPFFSQPPFGQPPASGAKAAAAADAPLRVFGGDVRSSRTACGHATVLTGMPFTEDDGAPPAGPGATPAPSAAGGMGVRLGPYAIVASGPGGALGLLGQDLRRLRCHVTFLRAFSAAAEALPPGWPSPRLVLVTPLGATLEFPPASSTGGSEAALLMELTWTAAGQPALALTQAEARLRSGPQLLDKLALIPGKDAPTSVPLPRQTLAALTSLLDKDGDLRPFLAAAAAAAAVFGALAGLARERVAQAEPAPRLLVLAMLGPFRARIIVDGLSALDIAFGPVPVPPAPGRLLIGVARAPPAPGAPPLAEAEPLVPLAARFAGFSASSDGDGSWPEHTTASFWLAGGADLPAALHGLLLALAPGPTG